MQNPIFQRSIGQVWTPKKIAEGMAQELEPYLTEKSRILDPCSGPGTFASALIGLGFKFYEIVGYEVDSELASFTKSLFSQGHVHTRNENFLLSHIPPDSFDALIINPPYIRSENIPAAERARLRSDYNTVGGANYFTYFLLKGAEALKPGGVMCAIIYDTLDYTRYGKEVRARLSGLGKFIKIEKLAAPFGDAIIDAEIFTWVKSSVNTGQSFPVSTQDNGNVLDHSDLYCCIEQLADVRRGTSFKLRKAMVSNSTPDGARNQPIITKHISPEPIAEINAFSALRTGNQDLDKHSLDEINKTYFEPIGDQLLNLPNPVSGSVLFNYFMRENVRHLLNQHRIPASDNFYCLTFESDAEAKIFWVVSNSNQTIKALIKESRPQGSGLRKLQLFEYKKVRFPNIRKFEESMKIQFLDTAERALAEKWGLHELRKESTALLENMGFK